MKWITSLAENSQKTWYKRWLYKNAESWFPNQGLSLGRERVWMSSHRDGKEEGHQFRNNKRANIKDTQEIFFISCHNKEHLQCTFLNISSFSPSWQNNRHRPTILNGVSENQPKGCRVISQVLPLESSAPSPCFISVPCSPQKISPVWL